MCHLSAMAWRLHSCSKYHVNLQLTTEKLAWTSTVKLPTLSVNSPNQVHSFSGEENHGPPHPQSHVWAVYQGRHQEGLPSVLPMLSPSAASMMVDWVLPGGTCGKGAGCVLIPHTFLPLIDNRCLTTANPSLKCKCTFAQNSKIYAKSHQSKF